MVALGFGLVAPALPLFATQFGVGKAAAGAVVSAFALMRLVMAPFVGRLVNAFGERLLLATGIGVVAVSSALAGLSQSYWQLLVLRGVGGIGSIMFSVSAASLLVRVTPSHLRGRAQGVWAGAFLIGLVCGPAVGTVATFSLRLPFFLYAGTLVVAGALGLGALRHSELAARQSVRAAAVGPRRRDAQPGVPRGPRRGLRRRLRTGRRPVVDGAALRARLAPPVERLGLRGVPHRQRGQRRPPAADRQDRGHRRPPAGDRGGAARRRARVRAAPGAAGDRRAGDRDGADRCRRGLRLRRARSGDGRCRRGPGRHRGRGLPDGRRPRPRPRPRRDRLGGGRRRVLTCVRPLRRGVCGCPCSPSWPRPRRSSTTGRSLRSPSRTPLATPPPDATSPARRWQPLPAR